MVPNLKTVFFSVIRQFKEDSRYGDAEVLQTILPWLPAEKLPVAPKPDSVKIEKVRGLLSGHYPFETGKKEVMAEFDRLAAQLKSPNRALEGRAHQIAGNYEHAAERLIDQTISEARTKRGPVILPTRDIAFQYFEPAHVSTADIKIVVYLNRVGHIADILDQMIVRGDSVNAPPIAGMILRELDVLYGEADQKRMGMIVVDTAGTEHPDLEKGREAVQGLRQRLEAVKGMQSLSVTVPNDGYPRLEAGGRADSESAEFVDNGSGDGVIPSGGGNNGNDSGPTALLSSFASASPMARSLAFFNPPANGLNRAFHFPAVTSQAAYQLERAADRGKIIVHRQFRKRAIFRGAFGSGLRIGSSRSRRAARRAHAAFRRASRNSTRFFARKA